MQFRLQLLSFQSVAARSDLPCQCSAGSEAALPADTPTPQHRPDPPHPYKHESQSAGVLPGKAGAGREVFVGNAALTLKRDNMEVRARAA